MTKICITGGAGFIAHHAIETILDETDWEIITVDNPMLQELRSFL